MTTVYVMSAPSVQMIKVGVTSNLSRRLAEVQAMSPVMLEVILQIPGAPLDTERTIHSLCRQWHSHGEWFQIAALPQVERWANVFTTARNTIDLLIEDHAPPERVSFLKDSIRRPRDAAHIAHMLSACIPATAGKVMCGSLFTCGAKSIAIELTNLIGESIMDRKYGS
jgi:hypothetical protein